MYVDVRDIAHAHVLALQKPEAGGNRFIIAAGPFKWQDFGKPQLCSYQIHSLTW